MPAAAKAGPLAAYQPKTSLEPTLRAKLDREGIDPPLRPHEQFHRSSVPFKSDAGFTDIAGLRSAVSRSVNAKDADAACRDKRHARLEPDLDPRARVDLPAVIDKGVGNGPAEVHHGAPLGP